MKRLFFTFILGSLAFANSNAQLQVARIFSDHMVIQREHPVSVWGRTAAGERVSVTFNGETHRTRANKNGNWKVNLPEMDAGGPFELTITSKSGEIQLTDILVGDVWLCSGQSNMEWVVANTNNAEEEIANATDPMIRHFKVPRSWSKSPEPELAGGEWQVNSPDNTGEFTAVGYYFARELRKHMDVPVGLLNSSWGGSRIEPWMSEASLEGYIDTDLDAFLEEQEKEQEENLARLKKNIGPLPDQEEVARWPEYDYDDSRWPDLTLPGQWEENGYPGMDGIAWARRYINLTAEEADKGITLHLAMIDDSDWTYVNGHQVGSMKGQYNQPRIYNVPAELLQAGKNTIAIRIEDTGGGGGLYGDADDLYLEAAGKRTSLAGNWKFRVESLTNQAGPGFRANQLPVILYNKMIHPILEFPIKGALWYQGESNANASDAYGYRDLFATMIRDWRSRFGVGEFPFLWVQLANFMAPDAQPSKSDWAVLRESQTATLTVPNTAQAVIIDLGEADDIHPRNKQDVGYRLSLGARKLAYGEDIVYSGPVFKRMTKDSGSLLLSFDHVGSGLQVRDKYGYVKGFAIAGADQNFVWAKARIERDQVRVWSEQVPDPKHVRYAWGNNPEDANLYNREGLPATPFRTDK